MTPEQQVLAKKELEDVLYNNPKSFVTGTRTYIADEYFALRLDVGTQQFNFALPPKVAKILAYVISEQVKNFESNVRKIDIDLPSPSAETINEVKPIGFDTRNQTAEAAQSTNNKVMLPDKPTTKKTK